MSTVRVLSGGATNELVEKVRPSCAFTIDGTFGAVGAMKAKLLAGEPADLMILSRTLIEELARDGKVDAGTVTDVATIATAVAVRSSDPQPPVGNKAQLREALLASDEIHFPDPEKATAGIHFAKVMRDLGIWDQVSARLRPAPNGATAMKAMANSSAKQPIGCTQESEIRITPGIVLIAPLPPGCELVTTYTAAVTTTAQAPTEARALIAAMRA